MKLFTRIFASIVAACALTVTPLRAIELPPTSDSISTPHHNAAQFNLANAALSFFDEAKINSKIDGVFYQVMLVLSAFLLKSHSNVLRYYIGRNSSDKIELTKAICQNTQHAVTVAKLFQIAKEKQYHASSLKEASCKIKNLISANSSFESKELAAIIQKEVTSYLESQASWHLKRSSVARTYGLFSLIIAAIGSLDRYYNTDYDRSATTSVLRELPTIIEGIVFIYISRMHNPGQYLKKLASIKDLIKKTAVSPEKLLELAESFDQKA
jgi:hypothetical protein